MASTVFLRPDTFPDFTDCAGTTPEPDGNWKSAMVLAKATATLALQ
jgi:hypothetical protein